MVCFIFVSQRDKRQNSTPPAAKDNKHTPTLCNTNNTDTFEKQWKCELWNVFLLFLSFLGLIVVEMCTRPWKTCAHDKAVIFTLGTKQSLSLMFSVWDVFLLVCKVWAAANLLFDVTTFHYQLWCLWIVYTNIDYKQNEYIKRTNALSITPADPWKCCTRGT